MMFRYSSILLNFPGLVKHPRELYYLRLYCICTCFFSWLYSVWGNSSQIIRRDWLFDPQFISVPPYSASPMRFEFIFLWLCFSFFFFAFPPSWFSFLFPYPQPIHLGMYLLEVHHPVLLYRTSFPKTNVEPFTFCVKWVDSRWIELIWNESWKFICWQLELNSHICWADLRYPARGQRRSPI